MFCLRSLLKIKNAFQPARKITQTSSFITYNKFFTFSSQNPLKQTNSYPDDNLASNSDIANSKNTFDQSSLNLGPFQTFNVQGGLAHFEKVLDKFKTEEDMSLLSTDDKILLLKAYLEIGQIYESQRRTSDSLNQYTKALEVADKIGMSKSNEAGSVSNALGRVYLKQYKFREAGIYLSKAKEIFNACPDQTSVNHQVIRNRYMMGVLNEFEGDFNKALELFEEILKSQEEDLSSDEDFNVSLVYQHMGNIYLAKGHKAKARENWDKSIDKFIASRQKDLNEVFLFCLDLMNNLVRLREYDEAVNYADKCLSYSQKLLGNNDLKLADVLLKVAPIYASKQGSPKAIETLQKAIDIYTHQNNMKKYYQQAAFTYIKMAEIHMSQSHEQDSQRCFDKAIKITTQYMGENHPQIGDHYSFWGDFIRDRINDSKKASDAYKKALDVYLRSGHGHEGKIIATYYKLGLLYFDEDLLDESLIFFKQALITSPEHLKASPKMLQEIYDYIGTTLFRQNKLKEGVEYFMKAGEAWTEVGDADAFNYVDEYYQNLGSAYEDQGFLAEATEFYQKALEMAVKNRGDQKDVIQSHLKLAVNGLQNLGKNQAAQELQRKFAS